MISWMLPYPPDSGAKMRAYHILRALAAISEVTLVCSSDPDQSAELSALGKVCNEVLTFPKSSFTWRKDDALPQPVRWLRGKIRYFHPSYPALFQRFYSDEGRSLLTSLLAKGFDLVWAERLSSMWLLPPQVRCRTIIDLDDLEYRKLGKHLSRTRPSRMFALELMEYIRLYKLEKGLLRLPYEFAVCSQTDKNLLGGEDKVWVVPNGVNLPPQVDTPPHGCSRPVILFTGHMSYEPNVDAVRFFTFKIFPLIRREFPRTKFVIAGQKPDRLVQELHNGESIIVTGAVPNMSPYFLDADIVVAPIRFGGGTRVKILESMGNCKPVVSTSPGAEGLTVQSGEHLLIADSPKEFAAACVKLLKDGELRHQLVGEGYDLVRREYDWAKIELYVQRIAVTPTDDAGREALGQSARVSVTSH